MALLYRSISDATLSNVLSELENQDIAAHRIVNIFHDGTSYVAVYVVN